MTLKAIAERLGVDVSTVSKALNNHPRISAKTREAALRVAREIEYCPNPAARSLERCSTAPDWFIIRLRHVESGG